MRPIFLKLLGSIGYVIRYGCIVHCTFEYVGDFVVCTGPSMEPTIFSNDILLTEHFTPRFRKVGRGDIIIAKCPSNPKQYICKRVTALPGDSVKTGYIFSEVVPRGHVWLEGDNSGNSFDSRAYGPVPQGLIKSRAIVKLWPPNGMRIFSKSV